MALSRSAAIRTRPSALLTIFDVTTTMSPSTSAGRVSAIRAAMSASLWTSGRPGTPKTSRRSAVEVTGQLHGGGGDVGGGPHVGHQPRPGAEGDNSRSAPAPVAPATPGPGLASSAPTATIDSAGTDAGRRTHHS